MSVEVRTTLVGEPTGRDGGIGAAGCDCVLEMGDGMDGHEEGNGAEDGKGDGY